MSVHAGSILHVANRNVIDRIQSAGLGDVRLNIETIREVGNRQVVDKVPGEPDFTFSMESLDVTVEVMAWLTGAAVIGQGSAQGAGSADPDGTAYDWLDCGFVNIPSPWKDPNSGSAGVVEAGHLIPGYYPTRRSYRYGVTENATESLELSGGAFFYADDACPVEQFEAGDGSTAAFPTDDPAIQYRKGGVDGTTFRSVFGVIVDGQLQTDGVDFDVTGGGANPGSTATVTFKAGHIPANGAVIKFAYFTSAAKAYPQTVHASTIVKPGAVRGRNIVVLINDVRIGGGQSFTLEATVDGEVERELGTEDVVGRVVNGTDTNGTIVVRAKDKDAFFDMLQTITGFTDTDEVFGWFNDHEVDLKVKIQNPKNPGQILKTLWVEDAKFQPPGTPGRVNAATDFSFNYESVTGTFKEVKGEPA